MRTTKKGKHSHYEPFRTIAKPMIELSFMIPNYPIATQIGLDNPEKDGKQTSRDTGAFRVKPQDRVSRK